MAEPLTRSDLDEQTDILRKEIVDGDKQVMDALRDHQHEHNLEHKALDSSLLEIKASLASIGLDVANVLKQLSHYEGRDAVLRPLALAILSILTTVITALIVTQFV